MEIKHLMRWIVGHAESLAINYGAGRRMARVDAQVALSGRYLVIVDSQRTKRPDWARPSLR